MMVMSIVTLGWRFVRLGAKITMIEIRGFRIDTSYRQGMKGTTMREADWIGKKERKFRWSRLKFGFGRWHYSTNCCGETIKKWWVWHQSEKEKA